MDENTRPWYTIDELNAWADKYQNEQWHKAAIRLGEELSSVGPDGYYDMDAKEWLDWAMEQNPRGKHSLPQRTWVGLTYEDMVKLQKDLYDAKGESVLPTTFAMAVEAKLKEKNDL